MKRSSRHLEQALEETVAKCGDFELENARLKEDRSNLTSLVVNLEGANSRMEIAARRFEELFQGLPIACLGYDESGAIIEWNRAAEELFGDAARLFRARIHDLLSSGSMDQSWERSLENVFRGESIQGISVETAGPENKRRLLCSTFPVHGSNGGIQGAMLTCVDITAQKQYEWQIEEQLIRINDYSVAVEQQRWELQQANSKLEALARTDGLTGIANHRSFQENLNRDVKQALRSSETLSLMLLDIDHFKKYNDSYGHPAGDAVLKQFAEVLLSTCRESDLVARYGGEEFAVIMPNTGPDQAMSLADRLQNAFHAATWPNRAIATSLGISTLSAELSSPAKLIAAADKALYASKRAGRNRVTDYGDLSNQTESAA